MTPPERPGPSPSGELGAGLYVHVPFCEALCSYCDFYSVARGDVPRHRYVDALEAEIAMRTPAGFAPTTVFVGGGTPTALDDTDFERALAAIAGIATPPGRVREWTVECNPNSLTAEKARLLVEAGVTRASIGVQSFDDEILRSVGRIHSASEARDAVAIARAAGIGQVSIDLLFAIPGQGLETFRRDLDEALRLGTDHVSAYALLYEGGTNITSRKERGLVRPEDEDVELAMMRMAHEVLGAAGFDRYEVSNFGRPGAHCLHNVNYWRNGEYLGLGPSAVSYIGGERRSNVASWRTWQDQILAGEDTRVSSERLPPMRAAAEELMVRLRLAEGASLADVEERWRTDVSTRLEPLLRRLAKADLLEVPPDLDRIRLTERGLEVADGVIAEILAAL